MQFSAALLIVRGCLVFMVMTLATAKECSQFDVTVAFQPIKCEPDLVACIEDTNVTFPFTVFTSTQAKAFCTSTVCQMLLKQTTELELPACTLVVGSTTHNFTHTATQVIDGCLSSMDAPDLAERVKTTTSNNNSLSAKLVKYFAIIHLII